MANLNSKQQKNYAITKKKSSVGLALGKSLTHFMKENTF